jgi:hypothetical protein
LLPSLTNHQCGRPTAVSRTRPGTPTTPSPNLGSGRYAPDRVPVRWHSARRRRVQMLVAGAGQRRAGSARRARSLTRSPFRRHTDQRQMPHAGRVRRPADRRRMAQPRRKPRHARLREPNRTSGSACHRQPQARQPPAHRSADLVRVE